MRKREDPFRRVHPCPIARRLVDPGFFELLIKRFGLAGIGSVADIGCGAGYLGMKLVGFIPAITKLFGLDFEAALVAKSTHNLGIGPFRGIASQFVQGDAAAIPLPDNSVDLAICQTLLLHLREPKRVIAEMPLITRPRRCRDGPGAQ